jgi:hypothetical protein
VRIGVAVALVLIGVLTVQKAPAGHARAAVSRPGVILFSSYRTGTYENYLVRADGTPARGLPWQGLAADRRGCRKSPSGGDLICSCSESCSWRECCTRTAFGLCAGDSRGIAGYRLDLRLKVGWRKVKRVVLHIGKSYSRCLACGKHANPHEERHTTRPPGYGGGQAGRGCGRKYTHVTTRFTHEEVLDAVQRMRPDLEFIPLTDLSDAERSR